MFDIRVLPHYKASEPKMNAIIFRYAIGGEENANSLIATAITNLIPNLYIGMHPHGILYVKFA